MRILSIILLIGQFSSVFGESLFDRYIGRNNGQIPYPPSDLKRLITTQANEIRRESGAASGSVQTEELLVPGGRSIQRNFASPANPRVLYGIDTPEGRIFIGFSSQAGTLEVMSWNQEAGRFDFQVVSNYSASTTPRVHTPEGNSCTSCHQNGGPIFPPTPWTEMTDTTLLEEMKTNNPSGSYMGVSIPGSPLTASNRAGNFQNMLDAGNNELQRANVCRSVCGTGRGAQVMECRRALLQIALCSEARPLTDDTRTGTANQRALYSAYATVRDSVESNWPSDNFAYNNPVLAPPSNALLESTGDGGFAARLRRGDYDREPWASTLDPRTTRPSTPEQQFTQVDFLAFLRGTATTFRNGLGQPLNNIDILECLGMDRREASMMEGYGCSEIGVAINRSNMNSIIRTFPVSRYAMMGQLLANLDRSTRDAQLALYCQEFVSSVSPIPGAILAPLADASEASSNEFWQGKDLFLRYCSHCHHAGVMPFNDFEAMQRYPGLAERLNPATPDSRRMPPIRATDYAQPTADERAQMIQAISGGASP